MVRLVRLLRYMPEVIILVKGLGVASRHLDDSFSLLATVPRLRVMYSMLAGATHLRGL